MCDTELTRQRFWLGSAAALMSAVSFSSNVALSKLAYDVSVIGLDSFYPSGSVYTRFLYVSDNDRRLDLAIGAK